MNRKPILLVAMFLFSYFSLSTANSQYYNTWDCCIGYNCVDEGCSQWVDYGWQCIVDQCTVGTCRPECGCGNYQCGLSCSSGGLPGVYDGSGNCYTAAGAQTNCVGILNCAVSTPESGYTRDLTGSCGRTNVYKAGGSKVCHATSCTKTSSALTITGSASITLPSAGTKFKSGDTIQITVSSITTTNNWVPLIECRLTKRNGETFHSGKYFNAWGTTSKTFSYTITQNDPSGRWSIDYCGVWTDFEANKGWNLVYKDGVSFSVDTGLVTG